MIVVIYCMNAKQLLTAFQKCEQEYSDVSITSSIQHNHATYM